jgi:hypothetical protein
LDYRFFLVPTRCVTTIKLMIFPFALSLSKGEWKNPKPDVKPFMLRQAQHERLNLMAVTRCVGMPSLPRCGVF